MTTDTFAGRVAAEIRAEMARRNVTTADLGRALDMSWKALHPRLTGARPFNVVELDVIAAHLGTTAVALLARAENAA